MGNKAVDRSLDIIDFISQIKECSLADISKSLGIPKASCFDIMDTLKKRGIIEYADIRAKTYRLSIKLYQIGCTVINDMDVFKHAHDTIKDLSLATGETCYFAVERDFHIVYIDKVESSNPIRSTCQIGSVNSMYSTGLGKAILAKFNDKKLESYLSSCSFVKKTNFTKVIPSELKEDLLNVRKRGYAIDDREGMDYVRCVAAPVLDRNSDVTGAISIASLADNMTDRRMIEFSGLVVKAAMELSRQLGFSGDSLY